MRARPWNDAPTFDDVDVDADAHLLGGRTRATRRLSREHDSFVVKPLIGASGHEVELVNSRDVDAVPGRLVDEHAAA